MATKLNTKKPGAKKNGVKNPNKRFESALRDFHAAFVDFSSTITEETNSLECAIALVAECVHHEMGMYLDATSRAGRKVRAAMKKGGAK